MPQRLPNIRQYKTGELLSGLMNLHFCFHIWMAGSQYRSVLPCINDSGWCKGVGGNFLVTLWLLSTTWPQFKCLNLLLTMSSIVHAVYPSSDGWSRITHQKAQIMSNWLLNHDTVSSSQSSRAPFGWMCSQQISNPVTLSC